MENFRNAITTLPDYNQLSEIASFLGTGRYQNLHMTQEQPSEWATPWEMIYEGDWCKFSVAIGMEFILRLSGWKPERLKLQLIKDYSLSDLFFILKVDNYYVLNYEYGKISTRLSDNYEIIEEIVFDEKYVSIKYNKYNEGVR